MPKKIYRVTYTASGGGYRRHWLVKAEGSNEAILLVGLFVSNLAPNSYQYQAKLVEFHGGIADLLEE